MREPRRFGERGARPRPRGSAGTSVSKALTGVRAFVLGGTRGIGRAISAELAAAGADVAAGYVSRDDLAD